MKIHFYGGADGVTGSCHHIITENSTFLLDCGMFQGSKANDARNREPFAFHPADIDFVLLSHAHVDHCGRLPLLVKGGFSGPIYCTDATADLLPVMLKDCAYIQVKETEYQNKKNERLGRPLIEPLYDENDVEETLKYITPVLYDVQKKITDRIMIRFHEAGHILGSAAIELWIQEPKNGIGRSVAAPGAAGMTPARIGEPEGVRDSMSGMLVMTETDAAAEQTVDSREAESQKASGEMQEIRLVFSGDIGTAERPILREPELIREADLVIMETTYGDRIHPEGDESIRKLKDIITKTVHRGGTVVIPAFAVGRTQEMIYYLNRMIAQDPAFAEVIRGIKVYVDSPMAMAATEVFRRNVQVYDEETRKILLRGEDPLHFENLVFTKSVAESQQLNQDESPKVILSASGMCEAGRIRHHLKHNLWDEKNSIVFVGYQAQGTLGRVLVDGAQEVRIFGELIHVGAEICDLKGFSGHADRDGLLRWLSAFQTPPERVFLVHGEEDSKKNFAAFVKQQLGYEPLPILGECTVDLSDLDHPEAAPQDPNREKNEELYQMRGKLAEVHRNLELILYNTQLAARERITEEEMRRLQESLLEIEKDSLRLSAVVAEISEQPA